MNASHPNLNSNKQLEDNDPVCPANTIAENQKNNHFANADRIWLFAYGSLIYKVDFPYLERKPAYIQHYSRRFWQGSHDHRGTPDAPGRVVTLIQEQEARCSGMAYCITPEVFTHLDHREKNGYLRVKLAVHFSPHEQLEGLVYIAPEHNSAFLGAAPIAQIAKQIAFSSGPSGRNSDYVLQLASALGELEVQDEHVFAVADQVRAYLDCEP